jgi:hypothetical protein
VSADTIVPGYDNPQNLNRYSYVLNNPLRYTDPTGHRQSEDYQGSCLSENQVTQEYKEQLERKKEKDHKKKTSAVATMATILDTAAAAFNGVFVVGADVIGAVCSACYLPVVGVYQFYSYIPNSISTVSMTLWIADGVATGENSFTTYSNGTSTTLSASISQDTIAAVVTNVAGWTVLRDPNAAFGVDAAVAGYDYGRLNSIPVLNISIPTFIHPIVSYNTSMGFSFSLR